MKVGRIKIRVQPLLKGNRVIPPASLYKRSRCVDAAKKEIEEFEKDHQEEMNFRFNYNPEDWI